MPALLTKISGELTRNNINNNNNNNICLPPNVETWITEPSNCHLAVLLYINLNSRENRVNNMWSFKRNTSFFEYYLVPFPEFQPSAGDFFKKKMQKKIQYWFARLFMISILGDCLFVSSIERHLNWTNPHSTGASSKLLCSMEEKKPDKMNVDHLSLRVVFFQERKWRRRCFDSDSCESEKKTQTLSLLLCYCFWGGKG